MIKGNVIKFGYGDVLVGSNPMLDVFTVTNIKPPQEIGTLINRIEGDMIEYGETIEIKVDCSFDLYRIIKSVDENNKIVKYKEWIFDFTNFNQLSVDLVLKHAMRAVNFMILAA